MIFTLQLHANTFFFLTCSRGNKEKLDGDVRKGLNII